MHEIPKPRLDLNGWNVVEELAMLSVHPSFPEAGREYFKLLARSVAEDMAYMDILELTGRVKPYPYAQLKQAPGVAEKMLEDALERARNSGEHLLRLESPSKATN